MNRHKNHLIFIAAIGFLACSQTTSKKQNLQSIKDWKTFDDYNYSIKYPDSYELDQSGQMGTSFILYSKITSDNDYFRENINLLVQDNSLLNLTIDEFVKISEAQINSLIPNGILITSERITTDETEYQRIIYSGRQDPYDLQWLQYCWVIDDLAYILTLSCEEDQFDNYIEIGEAIMNTFEIKRQPRTTASIKDLIKFFASKFTA